MHIKQPIGMLTTRVAKLSARGSGCGAVGSFQLQISAVRIHSSVILLISFIEMTRVEENGPKIIGKKFPSRFGP